MQIDFKVLIDGWIELVSHFSPSHLCNSSIERIHVLYNSPI